MARKPRVEYAGAFYHVICRGNQRQVIFRSDADRKYYLERLEEYRQRYEFRVYAYKDIAWSDPANRPGMLDLAARAARWSARGAGQ
jgi:hypothetical protein